MISSSLFERKDDHVPSLSTPPQPATLNGLDAVESSSPFFFGHGDYTTNHKGRSNFLISPPMSPLPTTVPAERRDLHPLDDSVVIGGLECSHTGSKPLTDLAQSLPAQSLPAQMFPPNDQFPLENQLDYGPDQFENAVDKAKLPKFLDFISSMAKFWTRPGFLKRERKIYQNVSRGFLPSGLPIGTTKPASNNYGGSYSVEKSEPRSFRSRIAYKPRQRIRTTKYKGLLNRKPRATKSTTKKYDVDYSALPDTSPPVSSLGTNSKVMRVDWKGKPLDLSNDPDRRLLHEAELHLSSILRLSCATYLCSKRRIFIARVDALRTRKGFRKTNAQQACKIDVNKASRLWSAFRKVGWFDAKYFDQYL